MVMEDFGVDGLQFSAAGSVVWLSDVAKFYEIWLNYYRSTNFSFIFVTTMEENEISFKYPFIDF